MPFPNRATQWRPGQSGNPGGRPRTQPLSEELRRQLVDGGMLARLVKVGIEEAIAGDFGFWKEIFDRVDGKVLEKFEHGGGLTVRVIYEDGDSGPAASAASGPEDDS